MSTPTAAGKLRLGDHCFKIGSGSTPRGGKEAYLAHGPFALIRSQNILNDRFSFYGLAFISEDQADQLSNVEVRAGDVLLNITGDSVARVCQVDPAALPARVNQHVSIIRPNPDVIDPRFLRYYLVSPSMQAHMLGLAASGATRNALTKAMIEDFEIAQVPIVKQRAIAEILGSLDDKIELNRRMNATLEAMALAIFRDWFVDFGPIRAKMEGRPSYLASDLWSLFPNTINETTGLPEGWREEPLHDQAHWINGAAYKNMDFSDAPDALPVVKIAELKNGITMQTKRTNTALGEKYRIENGELLFSWSGNPDTSIDAFIWTRGAAWLNQHVFAVRLNGRRSKASLFFMLKTLMPQFAEIARNKQTTGLGHVTKDDMRRLLVCAPSSEVANAYDETVGPLYDRLVANSFEVQTLTETRDYLLPKLMSGEIRIREAERLASNVA